jgi:hypothetical protein
MLVFFSAAAGTGVVASDFHSIPIDVLRRCRIEAPAVGNSPMTRLTVARQRAVSL